MNEFKQRGMDKAAATVVTQVLVDRMTALSKSLPSPSAAS
jgi:hypothetical protein